MRRLHRLLCGAWTGGRVAEGARLESVLTGNRYVGSNPTLSAHKSWFTGTQGMETDARRATGTIIRVLLPIDCRPLLRLIPKPVYRRPVSSGQVGERLKPPVSKTGMPARASRGRIPPCPSLVSLRLPVRLSSPEDAERRRKTPGAGLRERPQQPPRHRASSSLLDGQRFIDRRLQVSEGRCDIQRILDFCQRSE